ncbi:MAG: PQQ-dependent sugar dehydrogenase [Bacteroidia bacterium]|nr:PQQ-dependent sugar dehydrogenase [Bacteroidia bacterium]
MLLILPCVWQAQSFVRSELSTTLSTPWEMTYGPDNFLWLTESGGKISRVHPESGVKQTVYTAADYFGGSPLEQSPFCFKPQIGSGTLGMALHPQFQNPATAFIYFLYSYNSGTAASPATRFKVRRIQWNAANNSIVNDTTLIELLPVGYDHLGGRIIIVPQNGGYYLLVAMGDNGISETNSPDCYGTQQSNPNNYTQDPNYKNGKIHRFNLDGSIPADNPLPGNSLYTRGHRNPQGLIYNYRAGVIYNVEHGDRTDDEINVLLPGKNYGWKNVRGYMNDDNFPGEQTYISAYQPNAAILGDGLKGPLYAWCNTPQPSSNTYTYWCTVAPSDGIYYGSSAIPDWNNSLLVVTLKDGLSSNMELYRFKLRADGLALVPFEINAPNPARFFGEDQALNGGLRDVALSPDGTKIYLINNGGANRDKITVYTLDPNSVNSNEIHLSVYPNPYEGYLHVHCSETISEINIRNLLGQVVQQVTINDVYTCLNYMPVGMYTLELKLASGVKLARFVFGK